MLRSFVIAAALLATMSGAVLAQSDQDTLAQPSLRASVTVSSDIVRIGDIVENAGSAAQIAIFRAPDLGTTGSLPVAQLLTALRTHQVIGVDTRDLREVSITRSSRTLVSKEIEQQIARVLERRNGLGDAANISVTFERDLRELQLDAAHTGDMRATIVRFDPRNGRFDITFEIPNDVTYNPTKLRFIGTAVETIEAAVLTRAVERNEILRSSDVVVERRPKTEIGNDVINRDRSVGMQARKQMRAGQALKAADLGKPDLVSRDQGVMLIYEAPGLYLTGRGKALDSGTEGDIVNIVNLQSKRTVQGVVTGPGQVTITAPGPRLTTAALSNSEPPAAPAPESRKAE
ncbi:flagellar basal body P-ring formation chaperone FlgA [Afipia broomeae]|uniref:Flagella basal body P-ring formation protein FlgA n=1 Tax=Afipia broomeae ATCC 49717 TaxID=883078 RepID=K8PDB5_9BRAD|nr:flagellar basal body P-ring formation chaperone FlgA [Afipia broomeae]EKS36308.1 flagella basal body P-ring formation protein FlgA [Afipia broomeae ATCC 49717]